MVDTKDNPRKILLGNDVNFIWNIVDANFMVSNPKVYIVTAMGKHSIAMSPSPVGVSFTLIADAQTLGTIRLECYYRTTSSKRSVVNKVLEFVDNPEFIDDPDNPISLVTIETVGLKSNIKYE